MSFHLEPSPPLQPNKQREVTDDLRKSDDNRAEVMNLVRKALYDYGDLEYLADEIGRSSGCLYRIRGGYTRWPRWDTLFALLPHLNLALTVVEVKRKYHS